MTDPAGSHQLTVGNRADLNGERHVLEDGTAHADDLGQLLGSVDQAWPAGPGPDEVGCDDLVGDREVAVPQLQQPSAVELLVGSRDMALLLSAGGGCLAVWRGCYRPVVRRRRARPLRSPGCVVAGRTRRGLLSGPTGLPVIRGGVAALRRGSGWVLAWELSLGSAPSPMERESPGQSSGMATAGGRRHPRRI